MADTASLFTTGDVVLANPKESAALFAIVVGISVVLENVFGAFRENRSRFIKLLFLQISEEIMIVGVIGLFFVFVTQSIDNMPTRWLLLFRWIQTVLFFLMGFFILGVVCCALLSHRLIAWFRSEEVAARSLEDEQRADAKQLENNLRPGVSLMIFFLGPMPGFWFSDYGSIRKSGGI